MNELILHIGTPKTGTTAIQLWCSKNRVNLLGAGFDYIDWNSVKDRTIIGRSKLYGIDNGGALVQSIVEENYGVARKFLRVIKQRLQRNNVLLVSEMFWDIQKNNTSDILKYIQTQLKCHVIVIIYLRRQDLYLESGMEQWVKHEFDVLDFIRFKEIYDKADKYYEGIKSIEENVDNVEIKVRAFEREQFIDDDLLCDFLNVVGVELIPEKSEIVNERLYGDVSELKAIFNEELKNARNYDSRHREVIMNCFLELNKTEFGNQKSYTRWDEEERVRYMESHREANSQIAKEYLNRSDGILFYNDNPPKQYVSTLTEREIILTKTLAKIVEDIYLLDSKWIKIAHYMDYIKTFSFRDVLFYAYRKIKKKRNV